MAEESAKEGGAVARMVAMAAAAVKVVSGCLEDGMGSRVLDEGGACDGFGRVVVAAVVEEEEKMADGDEYTVAMAFG